MADYRVNKTALEIVNVVMQRLGVDQVSNLNTNKLSIMATDFLNDVLDDMADFGDFTQMYSEITVTAQSSVVQYSITSPSQNIKEIVWNNDVSPLILTTSEEIRHLRRTRSQGTPRHAAIVQSSGVNATFEISPMPLTAASMVITQYLRPLTIYATSGDNDTYIPFPARAVAEVLYALMVLEENGNVGTQEALLNNRRYQEMKQAALNRYTADTGTDVYIVPTGRYGGS